jgi:hypothetical protein
MDNATAYARWYERHKKELAQKRKSRYDGDPQYRKVVLDRAKKYREERRAPLPPQYVFTQKSLAQYLNMTPVIVRSWYSKDYYPEPFRYGPKLYFTQAQANLLKPLAKFLSDRGHKVRAAKDKADLQSIISTIYTNW